MDDDSAAVAAASSTDYLVSPELQKIAFRLLTRRVALDKETITYRLLSRELGITVQASKRIMELFLNDEQAQRRHVTAIWAVSGTLNPKYTPSTSTSTTSGGAVTNGKTTQSHPVDDMEVDNVDVTPSTQSDLPPPATSSQGNSSSSHLIPRYTIVLMNAIGLNQHIPKRFLEPSKVSKHVYALTPGSIDLDTTTAGEGKMQNEMEATSLLKDLSILSTYSLTNATEQTKSKWKKLDPLTDEISKLAYGGILNPDGDGRLKASTALVGKSKSSSTTTPNTITTSRMTSSTTAQKASSKGATVSTDSIAEAGSAKAKPIGDFWSKKVTSTSTAPITTATKSTKGKGKSNQEGSNTDTADLKHSVTPAKRKQSPSGATTMTSTKSAAKPSSNNKKKPPIKKISNGIFGEEELDSDQDLDGDDGNWDEDEMAAMEAEAEAQAQNKAQTKAATKAATTVSPVKNERSRDNGKIKPETEKERQIRELDAMMAEDENTPESRAKVTNKKPLARKLSSNTSSFSSGGGGEKLEGGLKKAVPQQKGIGSFFNKRV